MNKIKILICTHKLTELPSDNIYLPIQVGAEISDVHLGIQRDDQVNGVYSDNISNKNRNYCELTALYWAWKNLAKIYKDIEYIGISHYRRFFLYPTSSQLKILKNGGVIIPKLNYYPYSVEYAYCIEHEHRDIEILKNTIIQMYPDYKETVLKVFRGNKTTVCNMFIVNTKLFYSYSEWLFSILFEVEKKVTIDNYDDYQKRIFGFMAERLLYVYLLKNNIKFKTVPVKTIGIKNFSNIHRIFNKIRCNFSFFIGHKRHYEDI